ncbi:MAG: acyl-CoA dehydrogenase [Thermoleophilaceae bacterium]|nr:acyl-CoA dehydrogenase [Thermoleophilaceae bacterium]
MTRTAEADGVREALVEVAHDFAAREMRPRAAEFEESAEFPAEIVAKAAEVGLTSYDLPEEYGGAGIEDLEAAVLIGEELAWGDSGIANCIASGGFFAGPVVAMGTPEQKQRWLPPVCAHKPTIGALALSEPESGSDASALRTHAKKVDGGYVLNGQKTWVSGGPVSDLFVIYATVAPGTRSKGITAFVVERGDEGMTISDALPTMGTRCYPVGELFFDDCFVPDDRRIGDEGQGFRGVLRWFDRTRVQLAGNALGIGRAALEYAVEYAKEREVFGQAIHNYQAVSFRLVDAKIKLDQARLMTHHAARLADEGKPFTTEASMAKVAASEAAWDTTVAAVHTLGGYGYSREYPVERWMRAAKLEEIYEGTNDIQRLVIARGMFA